MHWKAVEQYLLFFNFTRFVILENLAILDLARSRVIRLWGQITTATDLAVQQVLGPQYLHHPRTVTWKVTNKMVAFSFKRNCVTCQSDSKILNMNYPKEVNKVN